ncbi:MAG: YhfC family intramembrane metalloprotease [Candidatus Bathyarchaeota archaeon]|nr:YhfC family intramembrane metalloprotease [Candidatus Bathyarchaeota archaeon]
MQNIDLIFVLQPVIVGLFSVGLIVYWRLKRTFKWSVLLYTFIAYAVAIALKYALQLLTAPAVLETYGAQSIATGIYFGLQTVIFEVGIAYVVAWYATSRGKLDAKDAEAYGLGLAFYENGVLLGLLPLINLLSIYAILSSNTSIASMVYEQLLTAQPSLFYSPSQALSLIGWGILERVSSLLFHFSWGYLCVVAAYFHKKRFLLLALPMGFIDFLVPFASALTLPVFEALIFGLSITAVTVAILSTRKLRLTPPLQNGENC